ncbi:G/U mismatch-specific uracil DNA glycosylase [Tricharina praecox]|uniref:G/U mismatch-specific uracil DNA glycosylase n=1 Tax=Tricharina praecox TaxID=43433 RepID=UPI00221ED77A|nr:G/U mismatch-specific uracil DNA glycosylase [Tricharina praecox]KAI5859104.1 G/U mismatch-specific uracil DNA glycosylase [Tricharina praecox]
MPRTPTTKTPTPSIKNEEPDGDSDEKPVGTFGGSLDKYAFGPRSATSSPAKRAISSAVASPIRRAASALATTSTTPPQPSPRKRLRSSTLKPKPEPDPEEATPSPVAPAGDDEKKKTKKKRPKHAGYAPPSKYRHLSGIPDATAPGMITLFIGTNPGIRTAETGHAYSAPSNHFWRFLHEAGLTPDRRLHPSEDLRLPELYSLGNTNLVSRPTKDQAELSWKEMEASVPVLEEKIRRWKPESVAVIGKGIWERIYKAKTGTRLGKEFVFGWQDGWRLGEDEGEGWEGARVFVAISTSGLVAGYSTARKLEIMKELGDWVRIRREERGETAPRGLPEEVVEKAVREREERFTQNLVEWQACLEVEELDGEDVKADGVKVEEEVED